MSTLTQRSRFIYFYYGQLDGVSNYSSFSRSLKRPGRVSIVTDTFLPDVNGVAMTLSQLCQELRHRGHQLEVVYPKAETRAAIPGIAVREVPGVSLPGYPEVRLGLPQPGKFLRAWRERRPDVVYVATETFLGSSALWAARKLGIRVVSGYHTHFPQYFSHYHLPVLEDWAWRYLRRWHSRTARTLVPAPDVQLDLESHGFDNISVLGRGVDGNLFHPGKRDYWLRQQWGAGPETPVALCVGRVAPEKNLSLAARCVREARKRFPDLQLVMVGDGPSREELASKEASAIHWAGMQRGEMLAAHYASADIFLFPSLTETYGNVLAEAMASGLVTLSFDYAASHELVSHRYDGYQVPFGDAEAFVRAFHELLAERSSWEQIRHRARLRAESQSWTAVTDVFESILFEGCNQSILSPSIQPNNEHQHRSPRPV